MPDFKVLRGSAIIPSGQLSLTLAAGTDFVLEAGIASESWFAFISNSLSTGMGRTASGGNQNADDVMVALDYSGDDIVLTRRGTANNCRVDWTIIQYTGSAGGVNEFIVREKGSADLASASATASVAVPGSVANSADVIPWLTGQNNASTGRSNYNRGAFTAVLNGSSFDFTRGATGSAATVSYALVEFTGSNWTITNEVFTNPTGTTNVAVTMSTAVSAVANTFTHKGYRYNTTSTVGLDDMSVRVRLTDVDELTVHDTTTTGDGTKTNSIWLAQNPDMTVTRYAGTMAGAGEEEIQNITIAEVGDLDLTFTTLTNDSTGGGTAFPRGLINHLLTSATNVLLRQSDNGQTSDYGVEVIELPEGAAPGPSDPAIYVGAVGLDGLVLGPTPFSAKYFGIT